MVGSRTAGEKKKAAGGAGGFFWELRVDYNAAS